MEAISGAGANLGCHHGLRSCNRLEGMALVTILVPDAVVVVARATDPLVDVLRPSQEPWIVGILVSHALLLLLVLILRKNTTFLGVVFFSSGEFQTSPCGALMFTAKPPCSAYTAPRSSSTTSDLTMPACSTDHLQWREPQQLGRGALAELCQAALL